MHFRRAGALTFVLTLLAATSSFAAVSWDVTIPVTGYLEVSDDLTYTTELAIVNHRDVPQYVRFDLINNGVSSLLRVFQMDPLEAIYLTDGGFASGSHRASFVGALRIRAILPPLGDPDADDDTRFVTDPDGRIEATAFIVAERGRFRGKGSTRQEVPGIPFSEYFTPDAVFLGARHSTGTGWYTNVGVVNLHPTEPETFHVQFQYEAPFTIVVPPLSLRQMRVPGVGAGGRWVRVEPEWSLPAGPPVRSTPWLAYTSTIDTQTGAAYSGIRVAGPWFYEIR